MLQVHVLRLSDLEVVIQNKNYRGELILIPDEGLSSPLKKLIFIHQFADNLLNE